LLTHRSSRAPSSNWEKGRGEGRGKKEERKGKGEGKGKAGCGKGGKCKKGGERKKLQNSFLLSAR